MSTSMCLLVNVIVISTMKNTIKSDYYIALSTNYGAGTHRLNDAATTVPAATLRASSRPI